MGLFISLPDVRAREKERLRRGEEKSEERKKHLRRREEEKTVWSRAMRGEERIGEQGKDLPE